MTGPRDAYSAAELAEMKLPGLPWSKRGVALRALRESWPFRVAKRGRIGVQLFLVSSLSAAARTMIEALTLPPCRRHRGDAFEPSLERGRPATTFDAGVTVRHRQIAEERMRVVRGIREALASGARSVRAAIHNTVPPSQRKSAARWWRMVEGRPAGTDELVALLPNYRACSTIPPHRRAMPTRSTQWFTVDELASMSLPGLPTTGLGIAKMAARRRWPFRADRGAEGHKVRTFPVSCLPTPARTAIERLPAATRSSVVLRMRDLVVKYGMSVRAAAHAALPESPRAAARWFRADLGRVEPAPVRARERARVVARMRELVEGGMSARAAARQVLPDAVRSARRWFADARKRGQVGS